MKRIQPVNFLLSIFELAVGIILLVSPLRFTSMILLAAGVLCLLAGVSQIILYLRLEPALAAQGRRLSAGLALIGAGAFLIFRREMMVNTFTAMAVFYGMMCIAAGLEKAQWFTDMLRLGAEKWPLPAAGTLLSLVGGLLILLNPFPSENILWRFTGALLVVVSIVDFVSVLSGAGRRKSVSASGMPPRKDPDIQTVYESGSVPQAASSGLVPVRKGIAYPAPGKNNRAAAQRPGSQAAAEQRQTQEKAAPVRLKKSASPQAQPSQVQGRPAQGPAQNPAAQQGRPVQPQGQPGAVQLQKSAPRQNQPGQMQGQQTQGRAAASASQQTRPGQAQGQQTQGRAAASASQQTRPGQPQGQQAQGRAAAPASQQARQGQAQGQQVQGRAAAPASQQARQGQPQTQQTQGRAAASASQQNKSGQSQPASQPKRGFFKKLFH